MQAYRITEWQKRYEFKRDKRDADEATPDEQLRQKPHEFIKWKVFGHKLGHKYRIMIKKAWRPGEINELAVIGLFGKLLEIAGDQAEPQFRGWILDGDQQPMDAKGIAEMLEVQEITRLREALGLLVDLGWVEKSEFSVPTNRVSCEIVDNSEPLQKLQGAAKIAKTESTENVDCNPFKNETETEDNLNKTKPKEISDPDFKLEDSVSDSSHPTEGQIKAARTRAAWQLSDYLRPRNKSDGTTIRDILDQLEQKIRDGTHTLALFEAVCTEAKDCLRAKNPVAFFVDVMKEQRFGYIPQRRRILGNFLR